MFCILIAAATFALVGTALALESHWGFEGEPGLGNAYYAQRVWQAAWLDDPQRTLLAAEQGHGLIAGRHVEPILVLAVPLTIFTPPTVALLLLQALLAGLGGLAVGRMALTTLKDPAMAVLCTLAWLTLPGLALVVAGDFSTLNLAIPFLLGSWAMLKEGRLGIGLFLGLAAAACHEEIAVLALAAIPALAWPGRPRRHLAAGVTALVASAAWLLLLRQSFDQGFHQATELLAGGALWDELSRAFALDQGGDGWGWAYAGELGELGGGSLLLLPLAPLAALVVLGNWIGVAATDGSVQAHAHHLWAVALAGLGLVLVSATARLERWRWPTRIALGVLILANLATLPPVMRERALRAHHTLSGDTWPSSRVGTPWTSIRAVPSHAPVLTDSRYADTLADRPAIYVTDDWQSPELQIWISQAVNHAVLPETHEWVPMLEEAGFERTLRGGDAVLLERRVPAPFASEPRTPG